MKANELSYKDFTIGDWVMVNDIEHTHPLQITEIYRKSGALYATLYWDGMPDNINPETLTADVGKVLPIPLTTEILEKNGFENGKLNFNPQYYIEYNDVFIGVTLKDIPDKHKGIDIAKGKLFFQYDISYIEEPIYVHQLQHALRLCGIEKEIEL